MREAAGSGLTRAGLAELPECTHCGGHHAVACPRVRSIEFHPDHSVRRVEFWHVWDESRVAYLEDLPEEDDEQPDES